MLFPDHRNLKGDLYNLYFIPGQPIKAADALDFVASLLTWSSRVDNHEHEKRPPITVKRIRTVGIAS